MTNANEAAAGGELERAELERAELERAELEPPAPAELSCGYCQKPLAAQYWQIAKRPACAECRAVVERELVAAKSLKRFLAALQYGGLAAAVGCLGWMLVSKLFHAQFGFLAIVLGYWVGKAVRKGTNGQGGVRYQVLALFLSYSAIVLARVPELVEHAPARGGESASALSVVGKAYALPFHQGASGVIGLFVIAIALYEAWKLTRALPLRVLGPFATSATSATSSR